MKSLYERILDGEEKIAVIGLGYVGLPIALAFSKKVDVIGFDINAKKINSLKKGIDHTYQIDKKIIESSKILFTSNPKHLKKAKFFIVAVPTPINDDKTPNLNHIIHASKIIGNNLSKGSIVVFESTVYPGVTEGICCSILEEMSDLKCGSDFKIGYSPERINPGDKIHCLENITKVISSIDAESLNEIKNIYEIIINAGTVAVSNIKTAEAVKVVENAQRDINIAFINEISMILHKLNIDTYEVIDAMNTKWNALNYNPGLVGGHCISVDPYYIAYIAEKMNCPNKIILESRKVNDNMPKFIADTIIKNLILTKKCVKNSKVAILGMAFKENCNDIRNSKVVDIISYLKEFGIEPVVVDPMVNKNEVKSVYGIKLKKLKDLKRVDCIVIAVAHSIFKTLEIESFYNNEQQKILIDLKGIYKQSYKTNKNFIYWSL